MLNPALLEPGHLPYKNFATGKKTYRAVLKGRGAAEFLPQYFKTATAAEQFAALRLRRLTAVYDRRIARMTASATANA